MNTPKYQFTGSPIVESFVKFVDDTDEINEPKANLVSSVKNNVNKDVEMKFDMNELDFGDNADHFKKYMYHEVVEWRIYEKFHHVLPRDVVLDIGANIGIFPYSLKYSNPSRVICIEPSTPLIPALRANTTKLKLRVAILNCGIGRVDELRNVVAGRDWIYGSKQDTYSVKSFKSIISEFKLSRIDFMKIDCEGGEYDVFTEENYEYITNNVGYIAGEWHLSGVENGVQKFIEFRDRYLVKMTNVRIFEPYIWKEVTHEVLNDADYPQKFYDWWSPREAAQLMIYIDNRW